MIRKPIDTRIRIALGVGAFFVLLLWYSWLSYAKHRENPDNRTIPNLSQFVDGWKRMVTTDPLGEIWLWSDLWATYKRLFLGVACGVALAIVIGLAMGVTDYADAFFGPPLAFFAKIPPTGMLAVYMVVVGLDLELYVAMITLGIFPSLAQSISQAARKDVSDHAIDKAYTLGASHGEVIGRVIWRQILPRVIESVRLQIGPAMIFLIAAEMVVADVGFGFRMRMLTRFSEMNVVYTYLIILGATGLVFDWSLTWLRRKLCPWFGE